MTPEVKLVDDYNTWFSAFLASSDVADRSKLDAGLQNFITKDTILNEPPSVPWGGTLIGYDGWAEFLVKGAPIFGHFVGRNEYSDPTYYQNGKFVLREFSSVTSGSKSTPELVNLKFIEKYTVEGGRISQIDEFYDDTAALLDYLAAEGILPARG